MQSEAEDPVPSVSSAGGIFPTSSSRYRRVSRVLKRIKSKVNHLDSYQKSLQ